MSRENMRTWGAMLAIFVVATTAVAAPSDATDELRRLTERRFEANAANDRGFYERLLAPNAMILFPFGAPQTKTEYLDLEFGPRPAGYRGPKATLSDFKALVDADTAVVSYRDVEPIAFGGLSFELRTLRVDTYVRVRGAWRLQSMVINELPSWPDVAAVEPGLYAELAGTYALSPEVSIVVTSEAGHLTAAMTGQPPTELFPESATTFFDRSDSPLARTVFERDAAGKVVAQVYRSHGQKLRAKKTR